MEQEKSTDLKRYQRYREDPWAFACDCVFTLDQVDKLQPIKPFPKDEEYLKYYFRIWARERRIAVPKSRRMFMSWANIVLYLHDTLFNIGRHQGFVSKKEEDADHLITRAEFIYDHIPEDKIPRALLPKKSRKYCHLDFPEIHSKIQAFASGADQLRQFTLSGILADEMAFWPDAQKMYSGAMPTLEGGGRITCISSAGPGFFKELVFDRLDTMGLTQ